MASALIGLGANLGDRQHTLELAVRRLSTVPGARVLAVSRWLGTRPVGGPAGQGDFLNGAALLETSQSAHQLHATLRDIETALGRRRSQRWEARSLDLDLLLYDDLVLLTPELELPHPGLAFRRFVLEPAAEVASHMTHPRIGWTIGQLLDHLNRAPNYAAIVGVDNDLKLAFASRLAQASGAKLLSSGSLLAASPADSPIQSFEQGIKLLGDWRRMLAGIGGEASATTISDFWWGEIPARASELPADQQSEVLAEWRSQTASVATPKLLIVLAPAREQSNPQSPSPRDFAEQDNPAVRATRRLISAVLQTPGHGPFLHCVASSSSDDAGKWPDAAGKSSDEAVRDAAAALEAMR